MSRLGAAVTLSASFSMARLAQRVLFAAAAWLLLASTGGAAGLTGETAARDAASPADYEAFLALQETPLQSADEELFLLGDAIWQRAYGETEFYLAPQIEDPHLYHARITSEDDKALGRAWSSLAFARIALSQRSLDLLTQMRVKVPEFVSESVVVLLPEIDLRRLTAEGIGITRLPEYGTEKAVLPEPSPSRSVIWSEDFETPFPGSNYLVGDLNSSDGTDTWDDVSCESYTGSESIWCADVGNYACTSYDDNMDAYVIKNGGVNVSGYDSVQFRFRKKYDTEAGYDKLWRSYSSNGSTWTLSSTYEGNSGGWTLSTITISNFSTYYWRFDFHSDDSVHEYEGAYLDTMEISGESTDFMEFSGTVRNSITGQGVSGASVSWGGYSTTTNSSGVYGFTNLPCETHTLTVSKSGYQTSSQTYTPICNFSNLKDVYLTPNVMSFGGTVRDSSNNSPISGASVSWGGYFTTTSSSGSYNFSNLPCGTYLLTVSKGGYQTSTQAYSPTCHTSNIKNVDLDPESMSFSGTVRDLGDDSPISGASVSWGGHSTTTNSSGFYSLSGLPCETHTLTVSKSGYQTYSSTYTPTCNSSNVKDVDLTPSLMSFIGTVRNASTGQPISGASVSWGGYSTTTSSSGFYSFSYLPCGTHTLTVSKSGYLTYSATYTPNCLQSNVKNVDLTPYSTAFSGTVRNADTYQGISGASVSWGSYSTTTSSSGSYSFADLPCESYTLTVSKSGYQTYSATYTPNCLQNNVRNVYLEPLTAFGGTVRDASNSQGISGASVSWGGYSTATSSSGGYSFINLPCETHTLTVSKGGYQTYSQSYTPTCLTSNIKNVDLDPNSTAFNGTVRNVSTNQGISGASVSWGGYSTTTNSSGGYSLGGLPCETHILTVSKIGYQTYSEIYTPACVTSNLQDVYLTPATTYFAGTVRNADTGQGVSGASVWWGGYSTTTSSSGGYSFTDLPCGTHTLTVSKSGYQTYSQTYTPTCQSSNARDVDLIPNVTNLGGTVRDSSTDQGIGGASVSWGSYSTTTSSSGGFSFIDLPCGTHTLAVSRSGYESYSQTYTPICRSSNVKDVSLTFNGPATGTTVITHGYRGSGTVPEWTYQLAAAIRDRVGAGRILEYVKDSGTLTPCTEDECGDARPGPESIIVFDWGDDSNDLGEGFSEAAGEALFAALVAGSQAQPALVDLDRLHLIGHSRGTVVSSEAAERLIAADFPAPQQITTLDPHDWGGYGPLRPEDPPDYIPPKAIGNEDFDVNVEHTSYRCGQDAATDLSGVCAWQGVGFYDNYFQEGWGLNGRPIRGAANLDLSDFGGIGHSSIHDFYHCTVDPATTDVDCDSDWFKNQPNACSVTSGSDPPVRTTTFAAAQEGFAFSRLGGDTAHCPEAGARQQVLFNFGLKEGFVNGDFDKNGSGGFVIPGWSYHGGGGSAWVYTPIGNNHLNLYAGQSRTHNRFFIPQNTEAIDYCWTVETAGAPEEVLRLVLLDKDDDEDEIALHAVNAETGWACVSAPVASSHRGRVRRLKVEVVKQNPLSGALVGVDNFALNLAASCTYSISPASRGHTSAATSGQTVSVITPSGCPWTATSDQSWITVTGGASGSGAGTVTYSVSANPNPTQRAGTITVGGESFTVTQQGVDCAYSIEPTSRAHDAGAASGQTVAVTAPGGCDWTAVSSEGWITVTGGASGNGGGIVTYSVSANPDSTQRSGTLTVAGESFTVTQQGVSCIYSIEPTSRTHDSDAASGQTVTVTAPGGCGWTAISNDNWIAVTGGAGGSGDGTVTYSISENREASQRTGTIIIAGEIFTVIQQPAAGPDLITEAPVATDTTPDPGQDFLLGVNVRNQGYEISDPTTLRYYVSTNSTISTADTQIGSDAVQALGSDGSVILSDLVTAPSSPGGYWVGACVDPVPDESDTTNQCSDGVKIAVGCTAATNLELMDDTILTTETFEACDTIFVGPNFAVMGLGHVTLRAGRRVVFQEEVMIGPTAGLEIVIELPAPPP